MLLSLCVDSGSKHVVTRFAHLLSNYQPLGPSEGSIKLATSDGTSAVGCGQLTLRSHATGATLTSPMCCMYLTPGAP